MSRTSVLIWVNSTMSQNTGNRDLLNILATITDKGSHGLFPPEKFSITKGLSCEVVLELGCNRGISTRLLPSRNRRCALAIMNSTAIIAQTDKDIQNLNHSFEPKVEWGREKKFYAGVQPLHWIKALCTCSPIPIDLATAYHLPYGVKQSLFDMDR